MGVCMASADLTMKQVLSLACTKVPPLVVSSEEEEEDDDEDEDEDDEDEDDGEQNDTEEKNKKCTEQVQKLSKVKSEQSDEGGEEDDEEDEDDEDDDDPAEGAQVEQQDESAEESAKESDEDEEEEDEEEDFCLDDFEMVKTVGTGTFGRVVLCRQKHTVDYYAMKILAITDVIRLKQVEHVRNEKFILSHVTHPFIIDMHWTHHDDTFLYMLFEYVCGGELFTYLRNAGHFSSTTSNFYAAEIVSALAYLHQKSFVYRDLKPENLLLDRNGHLKITDFGFAKHLTDRTWTLCGTPEYLAPEIIQSKGHNKAVDWWALGILTYEMLSGFPPFFDENPFGIYEKILAGKIEWPRHMDPVAKDLIKKLLVHDRTKRLGSMKKNGAEDVKHHRWFKDLNWDDVLQRRLKPPIMPKVNSDGDTDNFDDYPENDWKKKPKAGEREMQYFEDF